MVNDDAEVKSKEFHLEMLLSESRMRVRDFETHLKINSRDTCACFPSSNPNLHIKEHQFVKGKSVIIYNPSYARCYIEIKHIDYIPPEDDAIMQKEFNMLLTDELIMRGFSESRLETMSLEEKRDLLKDQLYCRIRLKYLKKALEIARMPRRNRLFAVKQAMLCAMHMENRVSERICSCLFAEKLDTLTKTSAIKFFGEIETVVKGQILGDETGEADWSFPQAKSTKKLWEISS